MRQGAEDENPKWIILNKNNGLQTRIGLLSAMQAKVGRSELLEWAENSADDVGSEDNSVVVTKGMGPVLCKMCPKNQNHHETLSSQSFFWSFLSVIRVSSLM